MTIEEAAAGCYTACIDEGNNAVAHARVTMAIINILTARVDFISTTYAHSTMLKAKVIQR